MRGCANIHIDLLDSRHAIWISLLVPSAAWIFNVGVIIAELHCGAGTGVVV